MLETTKKLYETMDKMMDLYMGKLNSPDMSEYMSSEEIEMLQICSKMYIEVKRLAIKQAEIIEAQDKKLDKILSMLEARSL